MSVSSEYVACIDFLLYIVKTGVVSVGYDSLALFLESFKVVDDFATKECRTILKSWFIDNDFCTFCLYPFHDTLYGRLSEIVGIRFHSKSEDTDGT